MIEMTGKVTRNWGRSVRFARHLSVYRAKIISNECNGFLWHSARVLDIGSGDGYVAQQLKDDYGIEVTCVDVVNQNRTNLPFYLFDGESLPFGEREFDITLLIYVLHHAQDPVRLLVEAKRVTKKRLIVYEDIFLNEIERLIIHLYHYIAELGLKTGKPLNLRTEFGWISIFDALKLKVLSKRITFSSWYDLTRHVQFVLTPSY